MQRFSTEIPWVLVEERLGGAEVACEVCGARGSVPVGYAYAQGISSFAQAHRVHQAPQGSMRLGDAVAVVAKPIARAFGLDEPCTPCEARRRYLNSLRFR